MKTFSLSVFILLLAALPVHGEDLPMLQSSPPGQLPSVNSITVQPVQEENLAVTCYLGNPNERNNLGEIVVMTPQAAGPTCNSMYYDCRGACFGCYSDLDLYQDICVDNSGRKFLW